MNAKRIHSLSSTTIITDESGTIVSEMKYTAFGEIREMNGSSPTDYLYTGQRKEVEFGLSFYNSRWVDSSTGHFISADTLIPQPGDSGNWDRYAYVLNNPLKYIDPSGKTPSPYIGPYCDPDDPNCTSYGQVDEVETVHVHQKKNTDCGHSAIVMAARLGTGDNSIPYESVQKDIGGVWADGPTLPNTMLKRVNDYLEKSPLRYDNGIYEGQYTYATREQGSIEQMAEEINKGNIVLVILIWEKIKYYGHWVVPISVTSDTSNNPLVSYLDPGFGKDKNRSFNYPESNFSSDPNDSFIEGFNRKKWWAPGITNTYIVIHHEVTSVNLDLLHTLFTANSPNIPRPE